MTGYGLFNSIPVDKIVGFGPISKCTPVVSTLCNELGTTRATLYRYVAPDGTLRKYGEIALGMENYD